QVDGTRLRIRDVDGPGFAAGIGAPRANQGRPAEGRLGAPGTVSRRGHAAEDRPRRRRLPRAGECRDRAGVSGSCDHTDGGGGECVATAAVADVIVGSWEGIVSEENKDVHRSKTARPPPWVETPQKAHPPLFACCRRWPGRSVRDRPWGWLGVLEPLPIH